MATCAERSRGIPMKASGFVLLVMAGLLMAGCKPGIRASVLHARGSLTCEKPPVATTWPAPDAVPEDRLEWNQRTLAGAYDAVGGKDARWDSAAREALKDFAELRSGSDTNAEGRLQEHLQQAVAAGCPDPLISYLNLRFRHGQPDTANVEGAQAYRQAGDDLLQSQYPPIRKFYAALRAAQAWMPVRPSAARESCRVYEQYLRTAFELLCTVLQDPATPMEEALDAIRDFNCVLETSEIQEDACLPTLVDYLGQRWPASARAWLLRGDAHIRLAWNRRGSGYADTVSETGWQAFARHLDEAAEDLETSWKLDPAVPDAAVAMITVEMGQGQGRDRMELWFDRAMKADPDCYAAASHKALYLQPKWYGSVAAALAFGRECVASQEWRGEVPLILWDVHKMLANCMPSGWRRDQYWRKPGVWKDVQASFERFFELNPEARSWRQEYALYAYKCGQYDRFLDLLPTLGEVRVSVFGGPAAFERMVAEAKKAAERESDLPRNRDAGPAEPPVE